MCVSAAYYVDNVGRRWRRLLAKVVDLRLPRVCDSVRQCLFFAQEPGTTLRQLRIRTRFSLASVIIRLATSGYFFSITLT